MAKTKKYSDGGSVSEGMSPEELAADGMRWASKRAANEAATEEPRGRGKGDGGYRNWATGNDAGDRADKVGDRAAAGRAPRATPVPQSKPTALQSSDPGAMVRPPPPAPARRRAAVKRPKVDMKAAMAKIEAHEARKRARDAAESGSDMPGYAKGGSVRGAGCAKRGVRPAKYY